VFLQRAELAEWWDFGVFVEVMPEVAARRAIRRDGRDELRDLYRRRYLPAQRRYLDEARPQDAADVVLVNDNPATPTLRIARAPVR
jgi:uridine kinase